MLTEIIHIYCADNRHAEREYVFSHVFHHRLNLPYKINFDNNFNENTIKLTFPNSSTLEIADILFNFSDSVWLSKESLPLSPLHRHSKDDDLKSIIYHNEIVELFGEKKDYIFINNRITLDIFGSIYFLLTGYEEYVITDLNEFGNFPSSKSVFKKNSIYDRPLADEYIEILYYYINTRYYSLSRKKEFFQFTPTHDIDRAFKYHEKSFGSHLKSSFGDLIKRRNLKEFGKRNCSFFYNGKNDPFNTYKFILDLSEQHNLKSIFFFKNTQTNTEFDSIYKISSGAISRILKEIHFRNHIIGFHPSYYSYDNPELMKLETDTFRKHLREFGIDQSVDFVRQHYLRYKIPLTSHLQVANGFTTDSTIGHWDLPGFRRGTCHSFYIFDIYQKKQLKIIENSLILMESSLNFISTSRSEQIMYCEHLINICKFYRGNFVLLWHNEYLNNSEERIMYESIISKSVT